MLALLFGNINIYNKKVVIGFGIIHFIFPTIKPACLPQEIIQYAEALVAACGGSNAARQAALTIIKEYYAFFGATGMRQDMWLLLTGALGSSNIDSLADSDNRLFFYEFTLLLFDAVYTLHASDRFGTLTPP